MRRLPPLGARGRPLSPARRFRGWLATWLQARRRARQTVAPPPNAPVITNGGFDWDTTAVGFADVWFTWTFDHGSFPVAELELWYAYNGGAFLNVGVEASNSFGTTLYMATQEESAHDLKIRYKNGSTLGPFSEVYRVDVQI